jgi:hypothetical protein
MSGNARRRIPPHLLERLRARRFNRQSPADQQIRLGDLVDRLRDELRIAAVDGVNQASVRRFVGRRLGC